MFVKRPNANVLSLNFGSGAQSIIGIGGWIASGESWYDVYGYLPGWRCISFDHRGSGGTSHSGPITIAAIVDDLLAVMDAQGVYRCVLAAHSLGAGVALQAVLQAPDRFSGLVIVDGAWKRPIPNQYSGFIERLSIDFDGELRKFAKACNPEPNGQDAQWWGYQILRRSTLQNAVELLFCRDALTAQYQLGSIDIPTLILHGTMDTIAAQSESYELSKGLGNAQFQLLAQLGHAPILSAPEIVAQRIDQRFGLTPDRASMRAVTT